MLKLLTDNPLSFVIVLASLLLAITIHEFAHAYAADKLGDPTPRLQGRLTLNPLAHLDPIGTILLIFVGFGWGRPVQFDPFNLENPRRDAAIISFAGPLSNIALAITLSLVLHLTGGASSPLITIFTPFLLLNVVLAVFNLIPIHPLDGGKVLVGLLPREDAVKVDAFLNRYGLFLLLFLIFPFFGASPVSQLIGPVVRFFMNLLVPGGSLI